MSSIPQRQLGPCQSCRRAGRTRFRYLDSASSRTRISSITGKLVLPKVAIVGLGGTGSFILDLIVKTPI
jgi:tRNA A37 threonylcarbamoyladenosine dehydratase